MSQTPFCPGRAISGSVDYHRGLRPEVAEFLPVNYSRVLEIGCGEGEFSSHLRAGAECWGVEPDGSAATIARSRLHRILQSTFAEAFPLLPNSYFDLVICNDVIEHMVDHDEFLRRIQEKLAENACIVGSIPNVRYVGNLARLLIRKDWEYQDAGVLDRTHLRFFTQKSLKRTLLKHGFRIEALAGINAIANDWRNMRTLGKLMLVAALGSDTRYLQFAFRISAVGGRPRSVLECL